MQRIPIGIREIQEIPNRPRELRARFTYRLPNSANTETTWVDVLFDMRCAFDVIGGAEFSESEIDAWVKAHNGQWSPARFLVTQIMNRGGSLPPDPNKTQPRPPLKPSHPE
jgi:hypothetical protein